LLRLQKTIQRSTQQRLLFSSMVFGLMILCQPLLTGCSEGGNGRDIAAIANPGNGNGNAYGLDNNPNRSGSPTAAVILAWEPVQDSSVTGYYVHFGNQSPNSAGSCTYTQSTFYSLASLANKSSPMVTLSGLASNTTYFFAVSAYNGTESTCSNEVSAFTQSI
jgi:fibronectin type III domain protein